MIGTAFLARLVGPRLAVPVLLGLVSITSLIALGSIVWGTIRTVKNWETAIYNNGFSSGSDQVEKRWNAANTKAALAQRDQVVADVKNNNQSVLNYIGDIAAKRPGVIRVTDRTTVYEKGSNSTVQCLDADGVSLIEDHRTALGYPASAAPSSSGGVSVTVPLP